MSRQIQIEQHPLIGRKVRVAWTDQYRPNLHKGRVTEHRIVRIEFESGREPHLFFDDVPDQMGLPASGGGYANPVELIEG